jgi:fibronectin type 3 domain-containing protein
MKKILLLLLSSSSLLLAKPEVIWDDPNPPSANIVSYIIYEQITSLTGVTYKAISKVSGIRVFNLPTSDTTKTYTVTAVSAEGLQSPMSEPLTIYAPMALRNLRLKEVK